MHTVAAARVQGRPILACPGELWAEARAGLQPARGARPRPALHRAAGRAPGGGARRAAAAERLEPASMPGLSDAAARLYALVDREPRPGRGAGGRSGMDPGGVVSALCELELLGLVVQGPGRRYQRV